MIITINERLERRKEAGIQATLTAIITFVRIRSSQSLSVRPAVPPTQII